MNSRIATVVCLLWALISPMPGQVPAVTAGPTPKQVIRYGGGGWKDGQVNEPCILVNPKDNTKLIMFFSGMQLGGSAGAIGKAWADVSAPFVWHEDGDNPLLRGDPSIDFESAAVRLDTVLYRDDLDEYWIYYTGHSAKAQVDAIGLATCQAGKDGYQEVTTANIKRHAGNPILSPKGQGRDDETFVSQGAVIKEKGLWHSLYSYRTDKQVLPGVRLATSPDGRKWTKVPGPDLLTSAPESLYIEWHQVQRIGERFVMIYEGYNGGTRWGADLAMSTSLTAGWKKAPVDLIDQTRWADYADTTMFHVATPALYPFGGKWQLYVQAAPAGAYYSQHWTLWGLEVDELMKRALR